jgi:integrase
VTLERADLVRRLTFVREPRKAPIVLSPEEVARLLEGAPGVKYKAALGAGLRVSEVVALKVSDINSQRKWAPPPVAMKVTQHCIRHHRLSSMLDEPGDYLAKRI